MKSFFERWPKPPLDNRSAAQASGNEAEMGAFNILQQPQRRANLTTALDADPAVPGSLTTPGRPGARADAPEYVAFHHMHGVGTQNRKLSRLNGWPMRTPVNASPRPSRATAHELGADVDRYTFIVRDLHPLLLTGLPALRISVLPGRAERGGPVPEHIARTRARHLGLLRGRLPLGEPFRRSRAVGV